MGNLQKRILLDTSAYSAAHRGHAGLRNAIQQADELVVNPVVLGELITGFRGGSKLLENLARLRRFLASERVHVVSIDAETAERYALIQGWVRAQARPIPSNDAWIAATAMQHGLVVVTTDSHFSALPQIAVDLHPVDG